MLKFITLSDYVKFKADEAAAKEEAKARGEDKEEKPLSAINPLRQPSIGGAFSMSLALCYLKCFCMYTQLRLLTSRWM